MSALPIRRKVPLEMIKLGETLKQLREERNLSMHEVARRNKILTPSYISKIEAVNTYKSVTVEALVAFSKVYEIPVSVLLERVGFLEKEEEALPSLTSYLKIKYNAPYQLITDMEIAWEVLQEKYVRQKSSYKKRESKINQREGL